MTSEADRQGRHQALERLSAFRRVFYGCLSARAEVLFELTDALLCAPGPVTSLAELSLQAVHRRGHGAMYDALACGQIEFTRLRRAVSGVAIPRDRDGRIRLAVDVTVWERPEAQCSPQRSLCHRGGRVRGTHQSVPGWAYSYVVCLHPGRTSFTTVLDALRIGPDQDATQVTATQVRDTIERLIEAGHWHPGQAPIVIVMDAGYDVTRLAWLLSDLPVTVIARVRSNRVFRGPPPVPATAKAGRPQRHGYRFAQREPSTHPDPDTEIQCVNSNYGKIQVRGWGHLHPQLHGDTGAWATHEGPLPIIAGTVINIQVQHLRGGRTPAPMWLWCSDPNPDQTTLDWWWKSYLRRFDIEHTFRFLKQTLGLTRPRLRTPEQGDRWVWLLIAAYTQLNLARPLTHDQRRPWEKPQPPERLSPARVRREFIHLRLTTALPAKPPKPSRPGPGRPPGSTSSPAPRYHPGKKHPKKGKTKKNTNPKG